VAPIRHVAGSRCQPTVQAVSLGTPCKPSPPAFPPASFRIVPRGRRRRRGRLPESCPSPPLRDGCTAHLHPRSRKAELYRGFSERVCLLLPLLMRRRVITREGVAISRAKEEWRMEMIGRCHCVNNTRELVRVFDPAEVSRIRNHLRAAPRRKGFLLEAVA